ncbi:hypothetical protein MMC24_000390 [Lignoscripta atroalba]|nr:hypothetical protein [Lignoscripta atroalba]
MSNSDGTVLGFTVKGECPNDPDDVRCCVSQTCGVDKFSGTCVDKSRNRCQNGAFQPKLCPGNNDVQCCLPTTPRESFVAYIRKVYNLAKSYGQGKDPNLLVMEWLRKENPGYNDIKWEKLIGNVDDGWISYAKSKGLTWEVSTFPDPMYDVQLHAAHFGACMNGVYLKGDKLVATGNDISRADVVGWGGDWITFYGDWRDADIDSGYQYCQDSLAKPAADKGTFKLRDMIEDADCYNIAMNLRTINNKPSWTVVDEIAFNLQPGGGGYRSRFDRFYNNRFGGTKATASAIAKEMLTGGEAIIVAGRTLLLEKNYGPFIKLPSMLSDKELGGFCDGFADVLSQLAAKS